MTMQNKTTRAMPVRGRPKKADAQRLRHKVCVALDDAQQAYIELLAAQFDSTPAEAFRRIVETMRTQGQQVQAG